MSDVERRREERREVRHAKRDAAAAERHRIRTTRTRVIPLPPDRMADLFAAVHRRNADFQYRITGPDTMRAWVAQLNIPGVVTAAMPQEGPAVSLRFEATPDDATLVTATVPDAAYFLGNGHLLGVGIVFTFLEEEVERWQNGEPS